MEYIRSYCSYSNLGDLCKNWNGKASASEFHYTSMQEIEPCPQKTAGCKFLVTPKPSGINVLLPEVEIPHKINGVKMTLGKKPRRKV